MKIKAYTYESDYHCPQCAESRFGANDYGLAEGEDGEGNPIQGAYSFDLEGVEALTCGTCGELFEV